MHADTALVHVADHGCTRCTVCADPPGCARAQGAVAYRRWRTRSTTGSSSAHRGEVAVRRSVGGVDVRVPVDVLPSQPVAGVAGELAEERPLGAAVALAERVQCVDLGEQRREAVEEAVPVKPAQVVRGGEAAEDVAGRVDDLVRQAERRTGPHDQHGAQLPRPRVDVLEDRPVEGAEVVEVVSARDASAPQLVHAHTRQGPLRSRQLSAVGNAQSVTKDSGARIQEGVAAHFR